MINSGQIKKELLEACIEAVNKRIDTARRAMENAQESANEETKSSAGDKYETGRAMAQIERDKNAVQLSEALKLRNFLEQINILAESETVKAGSLVSTNGGDYFFAVSLGKVMSGGKDFFVIAPGSPVGMAMMGKKTGDSFAFNNKEFKITGIW
jgi:transcription elongation GreA/GreB family factor